MFDPANLSQNLLDIEMAHYELNPHEGSHVVQLAKAASASYTVADIRRIASIIKSAFASLGMKDEFGYKLYSSLAENATEDAGCRKLASIGYTCLGRVSWQEKMMTKQAGTLARALSFIPGVAGEIGKLLAVTGLLGGAGVGASAWALNRALTGEDEKLRQLEAQRDTYGRLANEVREELKRRNLEPTPENTASAVDYLT